MIRRHGATSNDQLLRDINATNRARKFNSGQTAGIRSIQNYFGDGSDGALTVSADTNLTSTTDGDIVVKKYTSLTIDAGKTLTVTNRCKGLALYIKGDLTVNGTLSMSARGAAVDPSAAGVSATGLRFIRFRAGGADTLSATDVAGCGSAVIAEEAKQQSIAANGTIYAIARAGAGGGAARSTAVAGANGTDGTAGVSGGGASGGNGSGTNSSGAGASGTCFSGGSGGGGTSYAAGATAGASNGGAGGAGAAATGNGAGGGAGNPGGAFGGDTQGVAGANGTGGLLLVFVGGNITVGAAGSIKANGANGGAGHSTLGGGGGASGGGNILMLYAGSYTNGGTVQAIGGTGGSAVRTGGNGGAGSVQTAQISA